MGLGVGIPTWNLTSINLIPDLLRVGSNIDGFCAISSLWFWLSFPATSHYHFMVQWRKTHRLGARSSRRFWKFPLRSPNPMITWQIRVRDREYNRRQLTPCNKSGTNKQMTQLHRLSPRVVVLPFFWESTTSTASRRQALYLTKWVQRVCYQRWRPIEQWRCTSYI